MSTRVQIREKVTEQYLLSARVIISQTFVCDSLYRTEWLHKRHHTARVSVLSTAFEATRRFLENGKWFG